MADWKYTLDLKDDWMQAHQRTITPQELSGKVHEKLTALRDKNSYDLEDDTTLETLIWELEDLSTCTDDPDVTFDDVDKLYEQLCSWGEEQVDIRYTPKGNVRVNRCWIQVM